MGGYHRDSCRNWRRRRCRWRRRATEAWDWPLAAMWTTLPASDWPASGPAARPVPRDPPRGRNRRRCSPSSPPFFVCFIWRGERERGGERGREEERGGEIGHRLVSMKVLVVADGGQEMALHDNGNGLAPERDRGRWRRSRRCRGIFRRSPGRRRNRPDSVECAFLGGRQTAPPADPQLLLLRCLLLFLRCLLLLLLLLRYLRLRLLLHLSVMTCFLGMGSQERVIIKLLPSVESRSN